MNAIHIDDVIKNSFKNFHVKGMHYVCLSRSGDLTDKLYFFDGDVSDLPEVVSPHDHRYDFSTSTLNGIVSNFLYQEATEGRGERFNRFDYLTPLNGGTGFTEHSVAYLRQVGSSDYYPGQSYFMEHDGIHTIKIRAQNTILRLKQYEDKVPLDKPTMTFFKDRAPETDSGLYEKFTADEVIDLYERALNRNNGFDIPTLQTF